MSILTRFITPAGEKVAIYDYSQRGLFNDGLLAEWRVRYQLGSCYLDYHASDYGCYEDGESVNDYREFIVLVVTDLVVIDLVCIREYEAGTLRASSVLDDLKNYPDRLLPRKDQYRVQRIPRDERSSVIAVADAWYEVDGNMYRDVPVIMSEMPTEIRVLIRGLARQLAEILHPRDVGSLKGLLVRNGDAE